MEVKKSLVCYIILKNKKKMNSLKRNINGNIDNESLTIEE